MTNDTTSYPPGPRPDVPWESYTRVDLVKVSANQLKLQVSGPTGTDAGDVIKSRVLAKLDVLSEAIRSGDTARAELVLAEVRSAISRDGVEGTRAEAMDMSDTRGGKNNGSFAAWA